MERGGSSRPNSFYSQTSSSSCCSLSDSRAEMRDLMDSFIADVQRIRETFADSAAPSGHTAPPARSDGDVEMAPPVPGAYEIERPSTPLEKYEHKGIWCDSCRQKVMGIRHKCLDCYNYDLCNSCMTTKDIQSTHADMPHTFEAIYPPKPKPAPKPTARGGSRPSSPLPKCLCSVLPRPLGCEVCKPKKVGKTAAPQPTPSYRCDSCQNIIGGNRHKCMNCPDFDLCEACYTSGFPVFDHSPVHRFMHIEHPVRVYTAPAMSVSDTTSPLTGGCTHEGSRYKCENCDDVDLCMACLGSLENATIQHAAWHNEQRLDKPVRLVPYNKDTKLQTPKQSTAPLATHAADCDACDKTIVGTRHKCVVCHDFDLCDACYNVDAEPMGHKTEHEMLHLDRPQRIVTHLAGFGRGPLTRPVATSSTGTNTPRAVHNAWCDACSERIRGVRHKCLDCLDFDYCDACIEQSATHHNGEHEFYALVEPGQVVVRGISEAPVPRGRPQTNVQTLPPSMPAPPAPPVVPPAHQAPRPARPSQPSHSAACDMCSSRIRGVRYKCTACPDYDVCESCFRVSEEVHPGHSFAKVYKQGDIITRKSPQSGFRHHAKCDVCQNQIFGVRYKCIHPSCPDFDICERCEAMPFAVHPETHAFVKLKSHVSNYDGLRNVFSFAANRSQNFQTQSMAVPVPAPTVRIPTPRAFSSPLGVYHEPMTGTEVFHTATPSPIVPLSTLGCTIVPHTTIVPSLPQTPEPLRMLPQVPSPAIPSPTPERKLTDSWSAASSSAKLDEHKMHHSDMYKPSYEPPVVEAQPRGRRTNAVEVSGPHSVTVQEERDPEAPQMALVNSRPVSLPDVPMHEPVVSREPTPSIVRVASPEVVAPVAVHESIPQIIRVTSTPPYAFGHQVLRTPRVRTPSPPPPPQIIRIGSPDFSRIPQPEVIRVGTSPAAPERAPHIVYVPTVDSSSIPEVIRDSTPSASYGPRVVRVSSPILRPEVIRVSSPVSSSLGPQVVRIGSPARDQSPPPVVRTASAESSNAPSPQIIRVGSASPPEPEIIRIGTPIARPEPAVVRVPSPDVSSAPSSVVSRISTPPLPDTEPESVRAVESEVIVIPESIPASPEPELPGLLPAYPYRPVSPEPRSPIPDMVSLASSPSPSISSASIVSYTSPYEAAFIEDRTIVDGQVVSCGAEFTKIWRMRNTGTVAWPQGTTVSFVGGHYLTTAVHWPVNGDLSPGQDIEVEVEMKAPEEPGHYHSTWRLKTPEGEAFGSVVWCDINVAEIERAGSSGNSEVSASSIIVPTRAPGMSVATMSTTPASPEVQSVSSTIRTSSVTDMADDDDDISIGSEDSLDLVWEEVRRRGQGQ